MKEPTVSLAGLLGSILARFEPNEAVGDVLATRALGRRAAEDNVA